MKSFLPENQSSAFSPQSSERRTKGFTLIELMVVISIIAFLAVIGIAAFSQTQKQARDGRRRADIDAIAKAYESNFNPVAGTYIALIDTMFTSGVQPKDPSTNANYAGNTVNSAKGFWACATLEIITQGNASSPGGAVGSSTYPTFVAANNSTLYCKSSQQSQ